MRYRAHRSKNHGSNILLALFVVGSWFLATVAVSDANKERNNQHSFRNATHHPLSSRASPTITNIPASAKDDDEEHTCLSVESRWNHDNLQPVLAAWNFDPHEQTKLFELKQRLADIDHWKNDPAEVARFIKEHNFNVDKAEEMFRGMITWRQDHNMETFMDEYGEPPEIFHYAPIFLLQGLDREGDPIFVQRIGKLDGWGLYQRMGATAMLEASRFVSELHTSRDYGIRKDWQWQRDYYEPLTGRRVTQFTIVIDLEGLSPRLLRPALLDILQRSARIAQGTYCTCSLLSCMIAQIFICWIVMEL